MLSNTCDPSWKYLREVKFCLITKYKILQKNFLRSKKQLEQLQPAIFQDVYKWKIVPSACHMSEMYSV